MPTYSPYTCGRIADAVKARKYAWFENEYDLNIVGVRSADLQANTFNDWVTVSHKRASGIWAFYAFQATTDPGVFWRENPENVSGVAMLAAGQHRALWRIGLHQGKYPALVQNADAVVYRDSNRDKLLQPDAAKVETGKFGINCHRANPDGASQNVDKWSAGCQVLADSDDFSFLLTLCQRQIVVRKALTFTYTLLNEAEVK